MSQAGILSSSGGGTGAVMQVDTDNGIAIPAGGILNIIADTAAQNAGSTVSFSGSGNTVQLNVTDSLFNTIVGKGSGNATLTGLSNVVVGDTSVSRMTSGSNNIVMGSGSLNSITTGSDNIILGVNAGSNYSSNETSNILIGTNVTGINTESNTLRIGSGTGGGAGGLTRAFISGIDGVNVGSVATVVTENANQLGTAVLTAGTGISITPGANTITIDATGGSGITQVNGDSGSAVPAAGILNIIANTATRDAGTTVKFTGSGNSIVFTLSAANNIFMGPDVGNFTTSGVYNVALGVECLNLLTTGNENTVVGNASGSSLTSGSQNTIIGQSSGNSYNSSESNNICIGFSVNGTVGESNTTRIGNGATNAVFISGIDGINVGSVATVVTESGNKLGTAAITAGTGINVTAGANTITIATSGIATLNYTSVNSSPYVVLVSDDYISVDSSGGAITIQLPNAATLGRTYVIKDKTGSAATHNITVTTVGGAVNIDGAATFVMNTAYQAVSIIGNGFTYELY